MVLNDIYFDGGEHNICHNCVDEFRGGGKSETLKKVGDITMYGTDKSEEYEEDVEGKVIGGGCDEVSIMPVVPPRRKIIVSSICSFLSVGSSSKPYHPSLHIFIGARHIKKYFKKKRVRNRKFINPQEDKAINEERRKQMIVTVRDKLVVGFW